MKEIKERIKSILLFAKLNRKVLGDKGTLDAVLKQLNNLEKLIKGWSNEV